MKRGGFFAAALGLLFPPRCAACGRLLGGTAPALPLCAGCEKPLKPLAAAAVPHKGSFAGLFAAFSYSGAGAELMKAFKFGRRTEAYEDILRVPFEDCIKNALEGIHIDMIIPVPLYSADKRRRGFNQAEYIAVRLAERLRLPCASAALKKVRQNAVQHHLPRGQRFTNVKGVYACAPPGCVAGKAVLLVDDITTTGATLEECAEILLKNGAETVYAAAVMATPEKL